AEDGIRDRNVTGVQTCALPILLATVRRRARERDKVVHSLWYTSSDKPKHLIRVPRPKDYIVGEPAPQHEAWNEKDFASVADRIKIGRASCRERVEETVYGGGVE